MREAMRRNEAGVAVGQRGVRRKSKRTATYCSICTRRIWWKSQHIIEPEGVPEPRLSWFLCKRCFQALLTEVRRSPVQSKLRLRIAMGIVASEYWPKAYPTLVRSYFNDRKWIVFIAAGFAIAMLVHLVLIIMVAAIN